MANMDLNRLMRLAQKTGDKLIVADPHGGDAMVILPLSEYEALVEGQPRPGPAPRAMEAFPEEPIALAPLPEDGEEEEGEAELVEFASQSQGMTRPREDRPRPIARKAAPKDEPGEEQFYLEPV